MSNTIFTKATILTGKGTDYIMFDSNLPTAFPEMRYACSFKIEARAGYGETWLKENFPNLPYEVIKT